MNAQKQKRCPDGYRFDKALNVCVPIGVTRYYPYFGGRGNGVVPGIMTTDDSGCDKGYVSTNSENNYPNPRTPFNSADGHPENLNCNYLSTFSGTSASAPGVSGVVALILEANPNLSWRGVKHVLAYTSVPIDLNRTYEQQNIPQYNWTVNAAGYSHHHWYGFGQVDASAAVTYAQSFNSNARPCWNSY